MKLFLLGAVFMATVIAGTQHVLGSEEDHVIKLTGSDYEQQTGDGSVVFVKYFAPWCGHCKRLAPTWRELATAVKDNASIKIASVDCTQHRGVCSSAEVKRYPTLKVVHKGEEYKTYGGGRDLGALKTFIEDAANDLLTEST